MRRGAHFEAVLLLSAYSAITVLGCLLAAAGVAEGEGLHLALGLLVAGLGALNIWSAWEYL